MVCPRRTRSYILDHFPFEGKYISNKEITPSMQTSDEVIDGGALGALRRAKGDR